MVPVMAMPISVDDHQGEADDQPAVVALAVLAVTPRITNTNKAVKMTSHRKAPPTEMWIFGEAAVAVGAEPVFVREYIGDALNISQSTRAPTMPPANWAIQ